MKKGLEKTIEIIFIVFVLVIVSSVILGIFLKVFRVGIFKPKCDVSHQVQQAKQDCMQACDMISEFGSSSVDDEIEYCAKTEKIDGNCDGLYNEVFNYGTIESCEDKIPCFLLYPNCQELTPKKCKEILIKYNPQKYNQIASKNISGDCNLSDDDMNWIKKYNYTIPTTP